MKNHQEIADLSKMLRRRLTDADYQKVDEYISNLKAQTWEEGAICVLENIAQLKKNEGNHNEDLFQEMIDSHKRTNPYKQQT